MAAVFGGETVGQADPRDFCRLGWHVVAAVLQHSAAEAAELRRRGYQLKRLERSYGNQQVLYWDKRSGRVDAASDPRGIGYSAFSPEMQAQPQAH